ncbi:MAG: SpoIIE family protein phosphatase, partial [Bryobacteraceae bacterium]
GIAPAPTQEIAIETPDGKKRIVALDRERMTLGRSTANDLSYADDVGLSRQHLVLERDGKEWLVRDLSSKNGTQVNGVQISEAHRLRSGDEIYAGHLTLKFGVADAAPLPAQTVVFLEGLAAHGSSTVISSLEGALAEGGESETGFEGGAQMRALIRAGRELAENKPLAELFHLILDLSIEAVGAARGVLMTLEGGELIPRAAKGDAFQISKLVRDRVIREKKSLLIRDARLDQALADRMSIVAQQVRGILAAPLQTNDRVIGLIYLDSPHFVEFTKADLNLLTVMSNIAAIRIEHARLNEVEQAERLLAKELEQAAEIQRGLLPAEPPPLPGLELAGYNAACRTVGGDYYDFLAYNDGRVAMLVGDVSGKGMPASLMMSSLQARVQVLFDEPSNLAERVTKLNHVIAKNCPDNRFITFFIAIVDSVTGEVSYCNAGHNPPLVARRDGRIDHLTTGGIVLGILPFAKYEQGVCQLSPGDVIVLFSDGVSEACRPGEDEEFGEERLGQLVAELRSLSAKEIVDHVQERLMEWIGDAPAADDITLVVARWAGPQDELRELSTIRDFPDLLMR